MRLVLVGWKISYIPSFLDTKEMASTLRLNKSNMKSGSSFKVVTGARATKTETLDAREGLVASA